MFDPLRIAWESFEAEISETTRNFKAKNSTSKRNLEQLLPIFKNAIVLSSCKEQ